jgi:nucleoside-diphosphate-sugar epimerase
MNKIAVTGANGFIGAELCRRLEESGTPFLAFLRHGKSLPFEPKMGQIVHIESLFDLEKRPEFLKGCTSIVHLAAKVHDFQTSDETTYNVDNVDLTLSLLEAAKHAQVGHFVFMSSIKVYGEEQHSPYTVDTMCSPVTPYGKSKLVAEQRAFQFCISEKIALDIVRIPLVIGKEAKGNIAILKKLIGLKIPLPFGAFRKKRSHVDLDLLIDFVQSCIPPLEPQVPKWRLHLVANPLPQSTAELTKILATDLRLSVRLFPVPYGFFLALAFLCDFCNRTLRLNIPFGREALKKVSEAMEVVPASKDLLNPLALQQCLTVGVRDGKSACDEDCRNKVSALQPNEANPSRASQ